jgi:hypothetical protein
VAGRRSHWALAHGRLHRDEPLGRRTRCVAVARRGQPGVLSSVDADTAPGGHRHRTRWRARAAFGPPNARRSRRPQLVLSLAAGPFVKRALRVAGRLQRLHGPARAGLVAGAVGSWGSALPVPVFVLVAARSFAPFTCKLPMVDPAAAIRASGSFFFSRRRRAWCRMTNFWRDQATYPPVQEGAHLVRSEE